MRRLPSILLIASCLLLLPGSSAHAAVPLDAGCYICEHDGAYFMWTIIISASCKYPPSGGQGNGIFCHVTVDSGFGYHQQDCEFSGGECYYIEVYGRKAAVSATRLAASRLRKEKQIAYCF